jgi:hypothetical protein
MAWDGPSYDKPVWCGSTGMKDGVPTAQTVSCTTVDPSQAGAQVASLNMLPDGVHGQATSDAPAMALPPALQYVKYTDQASLGKYLIQQYHIRTPQELSSCETCHR